MQTEEGQMRWDSAGLCPLQNIRLTLQVRRHRATQEKAQPVCSILLVGSFKLTHIHSLTHRGEDVHELEQRIQSLQDELNEAHASKRRRLPSDEDTAPEHVQPSEASDSELPSPRNGTAQASFEAEADRGDGDGGSYTIKTPKGAMRFFGEYWPPDYRSSTVARMAADSTDYAQVHPLIFRSFLLRVRAGLKARRVIMYGAMSLRETAVDGG